MKLTFTKRDIVGKNVRSLRADGKVPVVCYGARERSVPYSVDARALADLLASHEVVIETDGAVAGKQVIVQDVATHPVTGAPIHADFLFVDATHAVEHEVPLRVAGTAPAVRMHGGQMVVVLDKVVVRALPQHIPGELEVDVTGLEEIGSHFPVSGLMLPDNVTLVTSPNEIIISIVEQSSADDEETTDETYMENIEVAGKGGKKDAGPADGSDAA